MATVFGAALYFFDSKDAGLTGKDRTGPAAQVQGSDLGQIPVGGENPGGERPKVSIGQKGGRSLDEYKVERERIRSRQVEFLEKVVLDSTVPEERRRQAQAELIKLFNATRRELEVENVLGAQGFDEAVAVLGDRDATVIVSAPLGASQAARIGDSVARVAGIDRVAVNIVDARTLEDASQ